MRAIQLEEFGGPEALRLVELPDPGPRDGEVVVEVARAGINFADTHVTRNDYLANQELPLIPGGEIAGRTPDGRRVAALVPSGGYAEKVAVHEGFLVPIPDDVSDDAAAALLLQGLTARSLLRTSARLAEGESVVIHAAAGGTGSLAVQLASRLGAGRVIALASSEEKRELARRLGADVAIDSRSDDLEAAILEANGGEPVDVVLEMSGGEAFEASLRALAPFGRLVTYGLASRQPASVSNVALMRTSRAVVGFWLVHLFRRPGEVREGIAELLGAVAKGELEVVIGGVYPLSEARRALEDIAARRTHGKLLLDPAR
ncbi:MAG TPA: NADPH:quinone oxidoreductase family protein [Solirubrobacterales bacterium]|nr:NADPH:quinone oxidoreductase family protein [Solirubrobacterales bacterium]